MPQIYKGLGLVGVNLDQVTKITIEAGGGAQQVLFFVVGQPNAGIPMFQGTQQQCVQWILDNLSSFINGF